jgi:hypothetical protein
MKCILFNVEQNRCNCLEYYEYRAKVKNGTCDTYKCPFFKEYDTQKRTIKEDIKNGKID